MTTEKPELENAIRIAIEAADAANSSAADIAEMKRQYKDAASQLEAQKKNFTNFSLGVMGSLVIVVGACGFIFFKTMSETKRNNATQIEALNVLTQNIAEIRTALTEVETVNANVLEFVQTQEMSMDGLSTEVETLAATLSETVSTMAEEAVSMQPQFASSIQVKLDEAMQNLQADTGNQIADLQVALSKMLAQGFANMPAPRTTTAQAAPAPRAAPKPVAKAPAPRKKSKPKAAPRPPSNPFKFP